MSIIDKVFSEESLIQDGVFHVVQDAYPVCIDHLLVLHRMRYRGCREFSLEDFQSLFDDVLPSILPHGCVFFERGNARFCTSASSPICSHIHVMPHDDIMTSIVDEMAIATKAERIHVRDLPALTHQTNEYLVFGREETIWLNPDIGMYHKRYVRDFIIERLGNG